MSQYPPGGGGWGGGGYPPASPPYPPYQQPPQAMPNRLEDLERRLAELQSLMKTRSQYPNQFTPGVIKYPDRVPFPETLTVEMQTSSNGFYGTTNEMVRGSINIDVENPTFITSISYNLYRPNTENNDANAPTQAIGVFLPLSAFRQPFIDVTAATNDNYIGRDFRWRIKNSSNSRLWQDGWKSSDQCNSDDRKGYVLPIVYEAVRNDVLIFEAEPIAPPYNAEEPQDFVLEVVLHIYKMVMPG